MPKLSEDGSVIELFFKDLTPTAQKQVVNLLPDISEWEDNIPIASISLDDENLDLGPDEDEDEFEDEDDNDEFEDGEDEDEEDEVDE